MINVVSDEASRRWRKSLGILSTSNCRLYFLIMRSLSWHLKKIKQSKKVSNNVQVQVKWVDYIPSGIPKIKTQLKKKIQCNKFTKDTNFFLILLEFLILFNSPLFFNSLEELRQKKYIIIQEKESFIYLFLLPTIFFSQIIKNFEKKTPRFY